MHRRPGWRSHPCPPRWATRPCHLRTDQRFAAATDLSRHGRSAERQCSPVWRHFLTLPKENPWSLAPICRNVIDEDVSGRRALARPLPTDVRHVGTNRCVPEVHVHLRTMLRLPFNRHLFAVLVPRPFRDPEVVLRNPCSPKCFIKSIL